MGDFNTSGLTPEEKQQLIALLQEEGSESPAQEQTEMMGNMGNDDAGADEDLIRRIIAETVGPYMQKLDLLVEVVNDEIIGGVTQLVQQKEKMAEIERLKTSYGTNDYFPEETQSFYRDATDGADLFDKLYEEISGAKGEGSDWGEEKEVPMVRGLASGLKEKMMKLRGPVAEAPVAVKETTVESNSPELERQLKRIKDMKRSGKANVKLGY